MCSEKSSRPAERILGTSSPESLIFEGAQDWKVGRSLLYFVKGSFLTVSSILSFPIELRFAKKCVLNVI